MLIVENLKKYFGDVRAVDGVNFEIKRGEIVSLVGANGAGKTTLVNLISGYMKPDSGRMVFLDRDITHASPFMRIKIGIGRSFQIINLFDNATVLDNVRIPLFSKYGKIGRAFVPADRYTTITKETLKILDMLGISDKKNFLAKDLGEGDKKVLDIAMTFALKSKLFLLDEPTSGVATGDKFKVMDTIISAIRKEDASALIIEHDMDIVSGYSDRVLVMNEGKMMAEGKPDEIMESKEVLAVLFGIGS